MLITTTNTLQGKEIVEYLGVASGQAIMGANVFIGLRFGVWETADAEKVTEVVSRLLRHGLEKR